MSSYTNLTHSNGIITTKNAQWYDCFIDNLITDDHIILPQTPMNWSENYSASYSSQEIIGSSRPIMMYTGTSLRTMSFSLTNLSQSYLPSGYTSLKKYVHMLQSLCFPIYSSSGVITAPECLLVMGERSFKGVFTSVNVIWSDEVYNPSGTGAVEGGQRIRCNVELSFTNTRDLNQIPRSNVD